MKKSKKANPYSSLGLDKFARLNAELSARREHIATRTGSPDALVRFAYGRNGWTPVVVKGYIGGDGAPEVSTLPPSRTGTTQKKNDEGDSITNGKNDDGFESQGVGPWISYFLELLFQWKSGNSEKMRPSPEERQPQPLPFPGHDHIGNRKGVHSVVFMSAPNSPPRGQAQQSTVCSAQKRKEPKPQKEGNKNNYRKELARIVSMDSHPRKPIRLNPSENRRGRRKGAEGGTMDAIVLIIVLLCLVFYGKLWAICCTSVCWYVLPKPRWGNRFNA